MTIDFHALFPDGISDQTAAAVRDLLQELQLAWEATYFAHLQRHHQAQLDLYDPHAPWQGKTNQP
jgi:hypothetical protein